MCLHTLLLALMPDQQVSLFFLRSAEKFRLFVVIWGRWPFRFVRLYSAARFGFGAQLAVRPICQCWLMKLQKKEEKKEASSFSYFGFVSFRRLLLETPAPPEAFYCPCVRHNAFVMQPWDELSRTHFAFTSKIIGGKYT